MDINFKVNCRECGQPMQQASKLLETSLYCKKCGLRATVEFEKTPIVKPMEVSSHVS